MITLPVFPPCTPGNFVPELRTLAPVNQKVNSHCHCDEDGDDNDYAKGTVGDNLIFLFHQRLKVLKIFGQVKSTVQDKITQVDSDILAFPGETFPSQL